MKISFEQPQLLLPLRHYLDSLVGEFDQIPAQRKELLAHLTTYVQTKLAADEPIRLTFICTHNSRRSHLSQIWAQTAAYYYGIPQVTTYSGGTEATAFNPRAVRAAEKAGFRVEKSLEGGNISNPVYFVYYGEEQVPIRAFSKVYNQDGNPISEFAAVMTCTHADENCPFIPGATRISLPFDDPKAFDGTPLEEAKYEERTQQIGREIFYAFSRVKKDATHSARS